MNVNKRPIRAEDLTALEIFSYPQLSPDGMSFAFVSTTIHENNGYQSHLFVQDLTNDKLKQWTFGKHKNNHPRFSPDGRKMVFQSERSGVPQIWLIETSGGEARQLTTCKHGAQNPHWDKDGRYVIFSTPLAPNDDIQTQTEQSKEEKQLKQTEPRVINRLKYKSDAEGLVDHKRTQIILYDVENKTIDQLTDAHAEHTFLDISPDGQTILFAANLSEDVDYELTNDLYIMNIQTKEITRLTDGKGVYHNARFSPDGNQIACFGHDKTYAGATLNELYVFNVKTGKRMILSANWDFQLGDFMISDTRLGEAELGPIWSKDGERLFFIGSENGATGLYEASLAGDLRTLYKDNNHVFSFTYSQRTDTFVLGISTPTDPGNFYRLDKHGLKQLTDANREFLDKVTLNEPEEIAITAEDGWHIQGWLLRPYGFQDRKKYPMILEIHGGPHVMYGQTFFHEMQLLAAKGYVVLYTNPRGSHGYGQTFVNACRFDYGGKDYSDLMCAVDQALENYSFIDEKRLGVTGGSYGGFMTNWIVGHTNRFKAAVTQRSISNWLSFYGVSDIGYFFSKWELGHHLLDDPQKLWAFSPLKYAENVETPLLILHGERDFRCPIEQGEQLFVTLKHLRKEVEFVRFPDANHELSRSGKPDLRIKRLEHICRFFATHL